jgi:recombination protein RecR
MFSGILGALVEQLRKLPGIGTKTAQRLALHIVSGDKAYAQQLSALLQDAARTYQHCSVCNMLSETPVCSYCSDSSRDEGLLCVVQSPQDVFLMENIHEYRGYYFVLEHLLSPLDGYGLEEIHFPQLLQLCQERPVRELILALNPSTEGESTMNFLADQLADNVATITRLSTGIPFGGDIEYTSSMTLVNAFKRRYSIND